MDDLMLLDPQTARDLREPCIYFDTRERADFLRAHIPDAIHMREIFAYEANSSNDSLRGMQQFFSDKFARAGLSGIERAIVYEDAMNNGNGQSCRGYFLLKYLGYPKVSVLHGGFKAWRESGFEVATAVREILPQRFPLQIAEYLLVTQQEMLAAIDDPNIVIVDVRDPAEWDCETAAPCAVNTNLIPGRIPGAIWLEWKSLIDCRAIIPRFKSNAEIIDICKKAGIAPDSSIYLYCYKGSRASSTYVALKKAGFTRVRNYFPSWAEWGLSSTLPIELAEKKASPDFA